MYILMLKYSKLFHWYIVHKLYHSNYILKGMHIFELVSQNIVLLNIFK